MIYTVEDGDSWASIAEYFTATGSRGAAALAEINQFPLGMRLTDGSLVHELDTPVVTLKPTVWIPDEWLKPERKMEQETFSWRGFVRDNAVSLLVGLAAAVLISGDARKK